MTFPVLQAFHPDAILIQPNRQRKEFDVETLHELQQSIIKLGLLHPIVLRSPEDPSLVAGERRLRACKLILKKGKSIRHAGHEFDGIPCTFMGALSQLEYEEAELEENICRQDLTWQERAQAIDRLHNLRCAQNPHHTMAKTAAEIVGDGAQANSTHLVRDSQIIAQNLSDPDVAKAKSKEEAMKIIRKKKEKGVRNELAAMVDATDTKHQLLLGDACQLLATLPSNSFDCILTDPPYGIDADKFGEQADTAHLYEDSRATFERACVALAHEGFRITKAEAHLYMFMDLRYWAYAVSTFQASGWDVWPGPIIWSKGNGMLPRPDHGPRRTYEAILYAIKGKRRVTGVYNDVIGLPPVASKMHGAQKPVELYTELLKRTCFAGDSVIDPFAGSGTIFPAANALKLQATGINLLESDYNLSKTRLKENLDNSLGDLFS